MRQLRNRGYAGAIITVSGDHTRATVVEAITAGIDDFLIKPFDRMALLEKAEKCLQKVSEGLAVASQAMSS